MHVVLIKPSKSLTFKLKQLSNSFICGKPKESIFFFVSDGLPHRYKRKQNKKNQNESKQKKGRKYLSSYNHRNLGTIEIQFGFVCLFVLQHFFLIHSLLLKGSWFLPF